MHVFAAVGTQKFQFNRLLKKAEELAQNGYEVFVQTGYSDYESNAYGSVPFLNKQEFEAKIAECDVLITHGGVGTIIEGIKKRKKVIVVPRLAKYEEHVDDHQVQIAEAFSEMNYILMASEQDHITDLVSQALNTEFEEYQSGRTQVLSTIRDYIHLFESEH